MQGRNRINNYLMVIIQYSSSQGFNEYGTNNLSRVQKELHKERNHKQST